MSLDRIIGGTAVCFGGFLLFYGIPANVRMVQDAMPYPAMFPQIAAWMFILLGAAEMVIGKGTYKFPSRRQFMAFLGVIFLTLIAILLMEKITYLPVMIALMAAITFVSHERRPMWMAIIILGLPIGVWLLFEQLLSRQLP